MSAVRFVYNMFAKYVLFVITFTMFDPFLLSLCRTSLVMSAVYSRAVCVFSLLKQALVVVVGLSWGFVIYAGRQAALKEYPELQQPP